jgi:hypothetical protein
MSTIRSAAGALALSLAAAPAALAHHGWAWTSGENIELTGTIETAGLGNPHGILTVAAGGEVWTVEVGQPWRHARAGLDEALYAPGAVITVIGEPSADPADRRIKAERVVLDGRSYDLYPDRD